ncbi:hypothetical protein J4E89_006048 [Alternaria sp. Ai002NY15]|nr:hypothetical protein J4E89_006048 [Alternaria sp. Ai002NY15]
MLGQAFFVLALAALAQAGAIVTNHCPYTVYIWSVPQWLSSSLTENVPLKPNGQYREPWHFGSPLNPGVAIKISDKFEGINRGANEIDFAYTIDLDTLDKVWVGLDPVRGNPFHNKIALHSCHQSFYGSTKVETHVCTPKDNIELVLCDTSPRVTTLKDSTSLADIMSCYDYQYFGLTTHGADSVEVHTGNLPDHVAEDTDSDSGSDTDGSESRELHTMKFTYTMGMTAEFSDEPTPGFVPAPSTSSVILPPRPASTVSGPAIPHRPEPSDTTSTTSRGGFFTPPAPAPRETDCPDCKKPRKPGNSPCLARVVYPARRRVPAARNTPDDIEPTHLPTPHHSVIPTLCNIVRRYHTGVEDCDESALESYARAIYPTVCDPVNASLLMGFPCEEVMEEMKKVYPAIDAPVISRAPTCECEPDCDFCGHFNDTCYCAGAIAAPMQADLQPLPTDFESFPFTPEDQRICLYSLCDPEIPGVSCNDAADLLHAILTLNNESYEEWVSEVRPHVCDAYSVFKMATGQLAICIADLCAHHPESCDNIQALLTSGTKAKLGLDVFFIKHRAVCDQVLDEST